MSLALSQTKINQVRELKRDFVKFAKKCLKIKSKSGKIEPLKLNQAQLYIHSKIEEQKNKTGKVRVLILKGRQQGASTYISGRYYHKAIFNRGVGVYILTHEQSATDNLFNMVKRYNDNNPIAPSAKNDSAKELIFGAIDSGYGVGTAGARAVGRSKTITLFHGSEAAFWPNAASHFAGVVQAVPDLPNTEIILESTANGMGGEFHSRWQNAVRGIGDYIAIFVPWYWSNEYARPVPPDFSLNDEEKEYKALYNLTDEQMVWRRAKIAELNDPILFKQEYPATADEAFQMSGNDSFIKPEFVVKARKANIEPIGSLILGVDPARFGKDKFAIAWRKGRRVTKVEGIDKCDTLQGATKIKQIIDLDNPDMTFVDLGGQGAGVYDMLVGWGYGDKVKGVNFGGKPFFKPPLMQDGKPAPYAANRRAEMWLKMRDWLSDEIGAQVPDLDVIQTDLCAPQYKYNADQNILLESKEDMVKRGLSSPDYADAIALTFAEPISRHNQELNLTTKLDLGSASWLGM